MITGVLGETLSVYIARVLDSAEGLYFITHHGWSRHILAEKELATLAFGVTGNCYSDVRCMVQ